MLVKAYDDCVCVCVCRLLVLFNFFFSRKKSGDTFLGFFFSLSLSHFTEYQNRRILFPISTYVCHYYYIFFFTNFFQPLSFMYNFCSFPFSFFSFSLYIFQFIQSLCRQICLSKILSCKLYTRIKYTNATKKKLWKKKI